MSRHTIVNLKQIEVGEGARAAGIDAHFARSHMGSEHLGISYFKYPASVRTTTGHHHREQEEAYIVIGGSGQVRLDDEVFDSRRGTSCGWPPTSCARFVPALTASR